MKIINLSAVILVVGGIGFFAGYAPVQRSLKQQQAAWQADKSALEAELAQAQGRMDSRIDFPPLFS
jgi:hypothetical protein